MSVIDLLVGIEHFQKNIYVDSFVSRACKKNRIDLYGVFSKSIYVMDLLQSI